MLMQCGEKSTQSMVVIVISIPTIRFLLLWYRFCLYLVKYITMEADNNLEFIREKIYEVRSAIMYNMSNAVIKIPNNIVNAVRVDEEGNLWFLCQKPMQFIAECEQHFPARLKFYRKGISYFLEVSGKASIVSNTPQKHKLGDRVNYKEAVLIKMSMLNIEYNEVEEKKTPQLAWLDKMYKWFSWLTPAHSYSH
jgi:hypothetical protein